MILFSKKKTNNQKEYKKNCSTQKKNVDWSHVKKKIYAFDLNEKFSIIINEISWYYKNNQTMTKKKLWTKCW